MARKEISYIEGGVDECPDGWMDWPIGQDDQGRQVYLRMPVRNPDGEQPLRRDKKMTRRAFMVSGGGFLAAVAIDGGVNNWHVTKSVVRWALDLLEGEGEKVGEGIVVPTSSDEQVVREYLTAVVWDSNEGQESLNEVRVVKTYLTATVLPEERNQLGQLPEYVSLVDYGSVASEIVFSRLRQVGFGELEAQRLVYAIPLLQEAQVRSGLSWMVLASLLGMEHSFLTSNPGNGDGPFQVTPGGGRPRWYKPGVNSADEFVDIAVETVPVIIEHAGRVNVDLNNLSEDTQAWFAYAYNGMPGAIIGPDGKTYYGNDPMRSGYVANNWNSDSINMYVSDGRGKMVKMSRDGYIVILRKLKEFDQLMR